MKKEESFKKGKVLTLLWRNLADLTNRVIRVITSNGTKQDHLHNFYLIKRKHQLNTICEKFLKITGL